MFNRISEKELEMIDFYRKIGAGELNSHVGEMCSTEHFLRFWSKEKQWLYKVFGEQLILSKHVSFKVPCDKIYQEIENDWYDDNNHIFPRFEGYFRSRVENYFFGRTDSWENVNPRPYIHYDELDYGPVLNDNDHLAYIALRNLITTYSLATTTFQESTRTIIMPKSGKKLTLVKNETKVMRIIQALLEELEIDKEYFEKFRIKHSKYFNQAKLEGELCISIHPLDYITMSENSLNWQSCMNWRKNGCYRRGTVEMINSPYIIVAYLKNTNRPFRVEGHTWNNKMWRQLFIVDEACVVGIKGYPYEHDEMTKEVIKWVGELVNNMGIDPKPFNLNTTNKFNYEESGSCPIAEFNTNAMYNDFGCTNDASHWGLFNQNIGYAMDDFNYSGESECVWCGDSEFSGQEDSELFACSQEDLACKKCSKYVGICDSCGERILDEDLVVWEDDDGYQHAYCRECAPQFIKTCPFTGESIHRNDYKENGFIAIHTVDNGNWGGVHFWAYVKADAEFTHPAEWASYFGAQELEPYRTHWGNPVPANYDANWNELTEKGKEFFRNGGRD